LFRSPVNSQPNPLLEFSKEKEKKKMHTKRAIFMVAVVVGLIWAIPFAKAGEYDNTNCKTGRMTPIISSEKVKISTFEYRGNIRSNTPDTFFDGTVHCVGIYRVVRGEVAQMSNCIHQSPDGSILVSESAGNDLEGTSKFIYGTGKFEGIEGIGKWKINIPPIHLLDALGAFENCSQSTGTYNLSK
jgi:hypothetical protein